MRDIDPLPIAAVLRVVIMHRQRAGHGWLQQAFAEQYVTGPCFIRKGRI